MNTFAVSEDLDLLTDIPLPPHHDTNFLATSQAGKTYILSLLIASISQLSTQEFFQRTGSRCVSYLQGDAVHWMSISRCEQVQQKLQSNTSIANDTIAVSIV